MEDVISQTTEYRTQQLTDIALDIRSWIVKVKYYIFMRSILIVIPVLFDSSYSTLSLKTMFNTYPCKGKEVEVNILHDE